MPVLAQDIGKLLKQKHLMLGTVESASGGLIAHLITNVPGSSDYYKGSIIAYSNEVKLHLVGVNKDNLDLYGSVSSQVAEEMAVGGCKALAVDICISDTGIAGPAGGTTDKPVGLFYLGLSHGSYTSSIKHVFKGDREQNKKLAATTALKWLKEYLLALK